HGSARLGARAVAARRDAGASMKTVDYWKRLDALLAEALALSPEERAAWLDRLAAEDAALRPKITEMLARSGANSEAFMGRPVDANTLEQAAETLVADKPGDIVGPFRLVAQLGSGGMGAVWRVEPVEPGKVQRQV